MASSPYCRINCTSHHSPLTYSPPLTFLSSTVQLISVISLLSADIPNTDSPANIDAAKQVREDLPTYKKKVS